jgi:hypothetical protein
MFHDEASGDYPVETINHQVKYLENDANYTLNL